MHHWRNVQRANIIWAGVGSAVGLAKTDVLSKVKMHKAFSRLAVHRPNRGLKGVSTVPKVLVCLILKPFLFLSFWNALNSLISRQKIRSTYRCHISLSFRQVENYVSLSDLSGWILPTCQSETLLFWRDCASPDLQVEICTCWTENAWCGYHQPRLWITSGKLKILKEVVLYH